MTINEINLSAEIRRLNLEHKNAILKLEIEISQWQTKIAKIEGELMKRDINRDFFKKIMES